MTRDTCACGQPSAAVKLRHRPTVVTGVLWDDTEHARLALADLGYRRDNGDFVYEDPDAPQGTRVLLVPTSERVNAVAARAGEDTVILGVVGEWYVIPPDVRTKAYDDEPAP